MSSKREGERESVHTHTQRAAYMREYRKNNPEYRKRETETAREWRARNHDKVNAIRRRYRKKNPQIRAKWRKNNPEKVRARARTKYLQLDDKCVECGSTENLEHHHPDYSKPDLTITLC
ncbi:unnamed protein product, partial [marine sediment metagenome]